MFTSGALNRVTVLKLNSAWLPLRPEHLERILVDMSKDTVRGLNIEYSTDENGNYLFDKEPVNIEPVTWDTWITLPVRSYDQFISTSKLRIRVPSVVVCTEYNKVPMKKPRLNIENLARRDGYKCCYTGKELPRNKWSMEHIEPRSKGGKTTWKNIALCDKDVNHQKGNKTPEEAGLKLLIDPKEPLRISAVATITKENIKHREWELFLIK